MSQTLDLLQITQEIAVSDVVLRAVPICCQSKSLGVRRNVPTYGGATQCFGKEVLCSSPQVRSNTMWR